MQVINYTRLLSLAGFLLVVCLYGFRSRRRQLFCYVSDDFIYVTLEIILLDFLSHNYYKM